MKKSNKVETLANIKLNTAPLKRTTGAPAAGARAKPRPPAVRMKNPTFE